jgi:hypothetical protein
MAVENLLRLAESSFSNVKVFEDCSGGNSRLSYLLGCGGRYFFDQEIGTANAQTLAVWPDRRRPAEPAFRILLRFQIPDFDLCFGLSFLCQLICLSV